MRMHQLPNIDKRKRDSALPGINREIDKHDKQLSEENPIFRVKNNRRKKKR